MNETNQLLTEYREKGSEAAFGELVSRYIGLVYSSALRLAGGDVHLAEDISQNVFIDLARNAPKLSRESTLGGWLHRDTCFVASKILRTERRRAAREREAALMNLTPDHSEGNLRAIAPVLDDAINNLDSEDRSVILLRFFEQHDFRSIGAAIGSNEDAARMRVNRALQKLQLMLKRQGVAMSAAALGTALTVDAVSAAPVGLGVKIASAALVTGVKTGAATTAIKIMAITKTQSAIAGAVVAIAIATPLFLVHDAEIKSRAAQEIAAAHIQAATMADDNAALSNSLAATQAALDKRGQELARLRSTAQAANKKAKPASNKRAAASTPTPATPDPDKPQEPYWAPHGRDSRNLVTMLILYANEHHGQLPQNVEDLGAYSKGYELTGTNQFEIVYQGSLDAIKDRDETIIVRETQALRAPDGKWAKVYGFANGTAQLHEEINGDFSAYEKEHGLAAR